MVDDGELAASADAGGRLASLAPRERDNEPNHERFGAGGSVARLRDAAASIAGSLGSGLTGSLEGSSAGLGKEMDDAAAASEVEAGSTDAGLGCNDEVEATHPH